MSDIAYFTIQLRTAESTPAEEPNCKVDFRRTDQTSAGGAPHVVFPPDRTFALPAFPQERTLYCDITPSLYQPVKSEFFTPDAGKPREEQVIAVRLPDAWSPEFVKLADLPAQRFQLFTTVIASSTQVDVKHGRDLGSLDAAYEGLTALPEKLAKMALLNLYGVTMDTREPIGQKSWFSFVNQIVRIDRERFVAEVKPELYDIVKRILGNLNDYKGQGFFTEPAGMHYDNIPTRYTLDGELITVKVRYAQGNVQFTMGKARSGGQDVVLLDCDMDEHSNIIEHGGDLFMHVFTGGTHPVDMHEYIVHDDPGVDLGYQLVPANAA